MFESADLNAMKPRTKLAVAALLSTAAVLALRFILAGASVTPVTQHAIGAKAASTSKAQPVADIKRYQVPVTSSQPSKGPGDALVTIVQWCELRSAACKDAEPAVRAVLEQHPEQVRLVFRHFVDPTKAPELAEFTRVAFEVGGKFWEARDLVMAADAEPTREDLERYAAQLELPLPAVREALDAHTHAAHVMADRMFATMFEVRALPAFFVNGRSLQGGAAVASLSSLVDEELARAAQLVAAGVSGDKVYAELTKNGAWLRTPPRSQGAWDNPEPTRK